MERKLARRPDESFNEGRENMTAEIKYRARPDSLTHRFYFPNGDAEAPELKSLATNIRSYFCSPIRAAVVGVYSPLLLDLFEDVLEASLLLPGDSVTFVSGVGEADHSDPHFQFGDRLHRGSRQSIRTRSLDWNEQVHRQRLSTRTFDVVLYSGESVEEASVYRILSRHASLSLLALPENLGVAFKAIAKDSTPNMSPTFAKAQYEAHCIPVLTTGTTQSVKDFVDRVEMCRAHKHGPCAAECPAFSARDILRQFSRAGSHLTQSK